nr:hypothetical protein [uncultured Duganella sp.]
MAALSAALMLAGAAALTATLMVGVARRRVAQVKSKARARSAGVPVTLASWSDGAEYQLAAHLQRKRR